MTGRKIKVLLAGAVLVFLFFSGSSAGDSKESKAVESSKTWLALVDSGKYTESWEEAEAYFKNAVAREQWKSSLKAVRTPLGSVISRKLKSKTYAETLPGAPDGFFTNTNVLSKLT